MSSVGHPVGPLDFRSLDFDRLWKGREKTTEVEQRVVTESIQGQDARRILEVGPGGGRIASVLLDPSREFVGVDVTLPFLARLRARWGRAATWVAADLARLPLASQSCTGAVLVRVYNFLTDPDASLSELHRVLVPGGWLLVSYFSEPSVATIWGDFRLRAGMYPVSSPDSRGFTPYRPAMPSRDRFRSAVTAAGFRWDRESSVGLEDLRPLRWLPVGLFLSLGRTFGKSGVLPHHFVLLRKPGEPPPELPRIESIVLCPECRSPLVGLGRGDFHRTACPTCGFLLAIVDGVPDLRPPALRTEEPAADAIRVRS